MYDLFHRKVRENVKNLYKEDFQEFVNKVFLIRYGKDFTCIKPKHDKGCDGIVNNNKVLAIYAPEDKKLRKFKKKVRKDYNKYKDNLEENYPEWCFVYNREFTQTRIDFLNSLDSEADRMDIEHIMEMFKEFSYTEKKKISDYLGIKEEHFNYNILNQVVKDMIKDSANTDGERPKSDPPNIKKKIELNFPEEDVNKIDKEFKEIYGKIYELNEILESYDDEDLGSLRNKIIRKYNNYDGSFKSRLRNMQEYFGKNHKEDDKYNHYVRVVLLYFFETCRIGKSPR